jgi:hypothetical protein
MSSCDEDRNVSLEIRSKCYSSKPFDRYRIIYSYPSNELGLLAAVAVGDSIYLTTGDETFLTYIFESGTASGTFEVLFTNSDKITGSLIAGVITIKVEPLSLPVIPVIMSGVSPTFTGSYSSSPKIYLFSFNDVTSILNINLDNGTETVNMDINLATNVIIIN